ncbi:hypothetical protein [Nesterenkonia muleiensis]|uniref:hypothetical protein n=1 Tax=Nesterenkonia muleiensis TaxID=2282648 RepID=UPI000E76DDA3|nr:hypothetical protein [Nesterenkonia muleiensis]
MGLRSNTTALASAAALLALLASGCSSADADAESAPAAVEESRDFSEYADEETDESEFHPDYVEIGPDDTELLTEEHLAEGVEMPDCVAAQENIHVMPGDQLTEDDLAIFCPENEVLIECSDPDELAANEGHEPAGWPQDRAEGEPLPDPECHPDFIEVYAWDTFSDFYACWEGPETSSMVRTPSMSDQDVYDAEWERSQLRAEWEVPDGWVLPEEWEAPEDRDDLMSWDPGDNFELCAPAWEQSSSG